MKLLYTLLILIHYVFATEGERNILGDIEFGNFISAPSMTKISDNESCRQQTSEPNSADEDNVSSPLLIQNNEMKISDQILSSKQKRKTQGLTCCQKFICHSVILAFTIC